MPLKSSSRASVTLDNVGLWAYWSPGQEGKEAEGVTESFDGP